MLLKKLFFQLNVEFKEYNNEPVDTKLSRYELWRESEQVNVL